MLGNTFTTANYSSTFKKQSAMNTIAEKSVKIGNHVSKNEMNALTSAYKQDRWAANTERLGRADSLSIWYTVEELENFLNEVKANGGNGVRIHFGVFPEGYRKPELVGMQTVVLVANRSKDGSLQNAKELLVSNNGKPEILALDGPIPCPPFCGVGVGTSASSLGQPTLIIRDDSMEVI
jgi:hypothetical protein